MAAADFPSVRVPSEARHSGAPPRLRTARLMPRPSVVHHLAARLMDARHMRVLRTGLLPMGVPHTVEHPTLIPDYLRPPKNARISWARSSGSSIAAKWPPRGITVHRWMLNAASAQRRGGRRISAGKMAAPVGVSIRFFGSGRQG